MDNVLVDRLAIRITTHGPTTLDERPFALVVPSNTRRQSHSQFQLLQLRVQPRSLPDVLLVRLQHARELQDTQATKLTQRRQLLDMQDFPAITHSNLVVLDRPKHIDA